MNDLTITPSHLSVRRQQYEERRLLQKVLDDSDRVFRYFRFVIVLDDGGGIEKVVQNNPYGVDGVVVIEKGSFLGNMVYRIVLEVGTSRIRPYAKVELMRGGLGFLPKRVRVASLSDESFGIVLPSLENCFNEISLEAIRERKWFGKEWRLLRPGHSSQEYRHYLSFVSTRDDKALLHSLFGADLDFRSEQDRNRASVVKLYLRNLTCKDYSTNFLRRNKSALAIRTALRNHPLPHHRLIQLEDLLPENKRCLFFRIIGEWTIRERVKGLGWMNRVIEKSMYDAEALRTARQMLDRPRVPFVRGDVRLPKGYEKKGGYILFQFFPKVTT